MNPTYLLLGACSGLMAVAVGGARAHWLDRKLPPQRLPMLEVGMRYQLAHAMAILISAVAAAQFGGPMPHLAAWVFLAGTALFSGCMYAYAFTGIPALLRMAPIGGLVLLAGWACLALTALGTMLNTT